MADCERVLFIHGKATMAVGETQTLTKDFLWGDPDGRRLRNTCECGSEGADCCNDNECFGEGCEINRYKWYSNNELVAGVPEGPSNTAIISAVGAGEVIIRVEGYARWWCDDTCGCEGDPGDPDEPQWKETGTLRIGYFHITVIDPDDMEKYLVLEGPSAVEIDDTATITATTLGDTETYTWESSDEDIATVAAGVVTPVALGSVVITCTGDDSGLSKDFAIEVIGDTTARVWFESAVNALEQGQIVTFVAKTQCEYDGNYSWLSTGGLINNNDGSFVGQTPGAASVTATGDDSSLSTGAFSVGVFGAGVAFASIAGPNKIEVDAEVAYDYVAHNFSPGTWNYSSSNSSVFTVDGNGVVTGVAVGVANLLVNNAGNVTSFPIEVVDKRQITPVVTYTGKTVVELADTDSPVVDVLCPNFDTTDIEWQWRSLRHPVATVDEVEVGNTNTVTPVAKGMCPIRARVSGQGYYIVRDVDIVPKQGAYVVIEHDGVVFGLGPHHTTESGGAPIQFTATTANGLDSDGYKWSVDSMQFDSPGLFFPNDEFHATREGTIVIRATGLNTGATGTAQFDIVLPERDYGHERIGRSGVCPSTDMNVEVTDVPKPLIVVTGKSVLGVGEKYNYVGLTPYGGDSVTDWYWGTPRDPELVVIDRDYEDGDPELIDNTAEAKGVAVGDTFIRATELKDGKPRTKHLSSFYLSVMQYRTQVNGRNRVMVGNTIALSPSRGIGVIEVGYDFESLNDSIATVDSSGVVTGVLTGTAQIKITGQTTLVEYLHTVNVYPATEENYASITGPNFVVDGLNISLSISTANLNPPVPAPFFLWNSSDTSIATVSGSNLNCTLTGQSEGTVTITATDVFRPTLTTTFEVYVASNTTPSALQGKNVMVAFTTQTLTPVSLLAPGESGWNWQSSDGWVATVNGSGVVTAGHAGECIIKATGQTTGSEARFRLKVYRTFIVIKGHTVMRQGENHAFTATTFGLSESYVWDTGDPCIVAVTGAGVVAAGERTGQTRIRAFGLTTGEVSEFWVTVVDDLQPYPRMSFRSNKNSSSWVSSGTALNYLCYMSSSSSEYSSTWAVWYSSLSSDSSSSTSSWVSSSSLKSSSWKVLFPYVYSSHISSTVRSSSGVSSWCDCDIYYVDDDLSIQYVSIEGPNKIRLGEEQTYTATGHNEGNEWYPCCDDDGGDLYWQASDIFMVIGAPYELGGRKVDGEGFMDGNVKLSVTRGGHILLHECWTKFNVLREYIINCAVQCPSPEFDYIICDAYQLEEILPCDCKADVEAKMAQWWIVAEEVDENCRVVECD